MKHKHFILETCCITLGFVAAGLLGELLESTNRLKPALLWAASILVILPFLINAVKTLSLDNKSTSLDRKVNVVVKYAVELFVGVMIGGFLVAFVKYLLK